MPIGYDHFANGSWLFVQ